MLAVSTAFSKGDKKDASIHVWQPESGMLLRAYRGGTCNHRSLHMSKSLVLAGQSGRPIINCWLTPTEQLHLKIPIAESISALAASDNDHLCAVGTSGASSSGGKLYIWEIATGRLLSSQPSAHFRRISVVRFSIDNAYVITGSDDATVKVWRVSELIGRSKDSLMTGRTPTARYTWSDHTLPVTDVCCGSYGIGGRVVTAAKDCCCKLYELETGELLRTFAFEDSIMSVALDPMERFLYAGGSAGAVYACEIQEHTQFDASTASTLAKTKAFVGHKGQVTVIAIMMDACTILTGSDDGSVRVWDTESQQCIRTYEQSDPITNLMLVPESWIKQNRKNFSVPVQQFSRKPYSQDATALIKTDGVQMHLISQRPRETEDDRIGSLDIKTTLSSTPSTNTAANEEISAWKQAAEALYSTAVDVLFQQSSN